MVRAEVSHDVSHPDPDHIFSIPPDPKEVKAWENRAAADMDTMVRHTVVAKAQAAAYDIALERARVYLHTPKHKNKPNVPHVRVEWGHERNAQGVQVGHRVRIYVARGDNDAELGLRVGSQPQYVRFTDYESLQGALMQQVVQAHRKPKVTLTPPPLALAS